MTPSYVKPITPLVEIHVIWYSFPLFLLGRQHTIHRFEPRLVQFPLIIHISDGKSDIIAFINASDAEVKPGSVVATVAQEWKAIFRYVQVEIVFRGLDATSKVSRAEIR